MIDKPTDLAKDLIKKCENVNTAVDMTAGAGNDSLFILENLNPNMLYAFDIQEEAKKRTIDKIGPRENFNFILDSHDRIDIYIKETIDLAVYNLGYLPKGDKTITTKWESTIKSLEKTLDLLSIGGEIIMTIYPGHPAGKIEAEELESYLRDLDQNQYTILKLNYINKINSPPYVVVIYKKC